MIEVISCNNLTQAIKRAALWKLSLELARCVHPCFAAIICSELKKRCQMIQKPRWNRVKCYKTRAYPSQSQDSHTFYDTHENQNAVVIYGDFTPKPTRTGAQHVQPLLHMGPRDGSSALVNNGMEAACERCARARWPD